MPHPPGDRLPSNLANALHSNHNKGNPSLGHVEEQTIATNIKKAEWFRSNAQTFEASWNMKNRPFLKQREADNYLKLKADNLPLFDLSGK